MWVLYLAIVVMFVFLLKHYMNKSVYHKKIRLIDNESEIDRLEKRRRHHSEQIGILTMMGEDMQGEYMNMVDCEMEIEVLKEKLADQKLI